MLDAYQTLLARQRDFVKGNQLSSQLGRKIETDNGPVPQTVRQSLQASLDNVKGIGKNLYEGIITDYIEAAKSGSPEAFNAAADAIKGKIQNTLKDLGTDPASLFGIEDSVSEQGKVTTTDDNFKLAQANLEIYKAGLQDVIQLYPELGQAFDNALDPKDSKQFNDQATKLLGILKNTDKGFKNLAISADAAIRMIGVPPQKLQEIADLRKEITELNGAEKDLTSDELQNIFSTIEKGAKDGEIVDNIVKKIKGMYEGKISPELEKKIDELANKFVNLQGKVKKTQNEVNKFNPEPKISGIQTITSFAGALGQVQTALRAVTSLTETWNNQDLTFGEKLMSSFMSISMLIPSVISSFSGFGTAMQGINSLLGGHTAAWGAARLAALEAADAELTVTAATAGTTAATEVATSKTELSTAASELATQANLNEVAADEAVQAAIATGDPARVKEAAVKVLSAKSSDEEAKAEVAEAFAKKATTAATKTSIAAKIKHIAITLKEKAIMIASNPVYAALAAVILTIVTLMAIWHRESEKRKKDAENAAKQAELAAKTAEASKKEYENTISLIEAYSDLYNKYKESGEGKEDLNKKAIELAQALGIENAELLIQAGLYDELLDKAEEYAAHQAEQAARDNVNARQTAADSVVASGIKNGSGSKEYSISTSNGHITLELEDGGKSSDENKMNAALDEMREKYKNEDVEFNVTSGGEIQIIVPEGPEGTRLLNTITQDLQSVALRQEGDENLGESETFEGLSNFRDDQAEEFERLEKAYENEIDFTPILRTMDQEISTVAEYQQLQDTLVSYLMDNAGLSFEEASEAASSFMKNTHSDIAALIEVLDALSIEEDRQEEFINTWNNWTPSEKAVVVRFIYEHEGEEIDPEDIENEVENKQEWAATSEYIRRSEAAKTYAQWTKDGKKTAEEWEQAYLQNQELFKEIFGSYEDFILTTDADRERLFNEQSSIDYNRAIQEHYETERATRGQAVSSAQTAYDDAVLAEQEARTYADEHWGTDIDDLASDRQAYLEQRGTGRYSQYFTNQEIF